MQSLLKKTFLLISLPLLFSFFLPTFVHASNDAVFSKLLGDVFVLKVGAKTARVAKLKMPLFVGDEIMTKGQGATADITFPNGDVVRVMSDSKLVIKAADFKKKSFLLRMKLMSGKIFNVVDKMKEGSKYEVETRAAVAGVRGTVWSAETTEEEGGEDVIMVKEGEVATAQLKAKEDDEVLVKSLKKIRIKEGEAPKEPESLTPEEIAMFDVLDDLFEEIKDDIRDEIKEGIAEDILGNDGHMGQPY